MNKNHKFRFYFLLLLNILIVQTSIAQKSATAIDAKTIAGNYSEGSTARIYIYEDGTFAIIGYGTLVFGKYKIDNNQINFTPNIPKQAFTVLGRENKEMKKGGGDAANFTFSRKFLSHGPTYIDDGDGFMKVSPDDYNGGKSHYSVDFTKKPTTIILGQNSINSMHSYNTNTFNLEGKYNEFLLFYHPTINEQKAFSGKIKTEKGVKILVCTWGTFVNDKIEDEMTEFLINYKKEDKKNDSTKVFYFNDHLKATNGYNSLSEKKNIFNISNYTLDDASNKYILKTIFKKGKKYMNTLVDEYHNEDIILEYHSIDATNQTITNFDTIKIRENTLFTSDNEGKELKKDILENRDSDEVIIVKPSSVVPIPTPVLKKKKK